MAIRNFKYQVVEKFGAWQVVNVRKNTIEKTFDGEDEGANKAAAFDWVQSALYADAQFAAEGR